MKIRRNLFAYAAILILPQLLWQCCCTDRHFRGKVVDMGGKPISGVSVSVGSHKAETGNEGTFEVCVDRAKKYVLNASKFEYGLASKIYNDTSSQVLITLAKATVVTGSPREAIVVKDVRPEIRGPRRNEEVSHPLDTIPFVYNSKGKLIGFRAPQDIVDGDKAIRNFQPPVIGAQVTIDPGTLVFEGTQEVPPGDVQVSLNTIDIYSADGMPGDYTMNLGEGRQGFMVTFGAANILARYQDRPLQLADGKTATLTIPVDTLSIIRKDPLPDEIPLLLYVEATGMWERRGVGKINATRDAYTAEIGHFSAYNMDLDRTSPSCLQLCLLQTAATPGMEVTSEGKTKTMDNGTSDCPDQGDCAIYSKLKGATTVATGVINLNQDKAVRIVTKDGSTIKNTYIFDSGPQPGGGSIPVATYQDCEYDDCTGPFFVTDADVGCWEKNDGTGGMHGAILSATDRNCVTDCTFNFTWIFIRQVDPVTGAINNGSIHYRIQYSNLENFSGATQFVDFAGASIVNSSAWYNTRTGTVPGPVPATLYFRVQYSIDYNPGGAPPSGKFFMGAKDCDGPACDTAMDRCAAIAQCINEGTPATPCP